MNVMNHSDTDLKVSVKQRPYKKSFQSLGGNFRKDTQAKSGECDPLVNKTDKPGCRDR